MTRRDINRMNWTHRVFRQLALSGECICVALPRFSPRPHLFRALPLRTFDGVLFRHTAGLRRPSRHPDPVLPRRPNNQEKILGRERGLKAVKLKSRPPQSSQALSELYQTHSL